MDLKKRAIMNMEKGEEIVGGWVTPRIPQVGIYKLVAKKRNDGVIEWAHYVQRENGTKEVVLRGDVTSLEQLDSILKLANKNMSQLFGVTMQEVEYSMYALNGKKASTIKH